MDKKVCQIEPAKLGWIQHDSQHYESERREGVHLHHARITTAVDYSPLLDALASDDLSELSCRFGVFGEDETN